MKYTTVLGIPEGIIQKGPGEVPCSKIGRTRLRILIVRHPRRHQYIVFYRGDSGVLNEVQIAKLIELSKRKYIVLCGYLPFEALFVEKYKENFKRYLESLQFGLHVTSVKDIEKFFDVARLPLPQVKEVRTRAGLIPGENAKKFDEYRKRNCDILRKILEGNKQKAIALEYSLTTERIKQIYEKVLRILRWRSTVLATEEEKDEVRDLFSDIKKNKEFLLSKLDAYAESLAKDNS